MATQHLSIPVVGPALRQSPVPHDPRTDYRDALAACRPPAAGELPVDLHLARALVDALRGQSGHALSLLARVSPDGLDADQAYRHAVYRFVASSAHWNLFPGTTCGDSVELQARYADYWAAAAGYPPMPGSADTAPQVEQRVLDLAVIRPPFVRYLLTATTERGEPLVAALTPLDGSLAEVRTALSPEVHWQLALALADLHCFAGPPDGVRVLGAELGDPADASCVPMQDLWRARRLAAPWSCPEAWNLTLRGGVDDTGGLSAATEVFEDRRRGADVDLAATLVDAAEAAFEGLGLDAGRAQALLCRAYVRSLRGDWAGARDEARVAASLFEQTGHAAAQQLATAHGCLYAIGANTGDVDLPAARAIGSWGSGDGSFSYTTGIGLLALRAARHRVLRLGEAEQALATYAWAQALFAELGTELHEVQAIVCAATVTHGLGAGTRARRRLEEADARCQAALATRPQPLAPLLEGAQRLIAGRLHLLASSVMDPDGLEQAARRLAAVPAPPTEDPAGAEQASDPVASVAQSVGGVAAMLAAWQWQTARAEAEMYRGRKVLERGGPQREADAHFARAAQLAEEAEYPTGLFLAASVHAHQREWDVAEALYDAYLDATVPPPVADVTGPAWQLHEQQSRNRDVQALHFFAGIRRPARAKEVLTGLIERYGEEFWSAEDKPWETLSTVGDVHRLSGEPAPALDCYDRALEQVEARRSRLTQDVLRLAFTGPAVYSTYLGAAWARLDRADDLPLVERWRRSFGYLQQGKARALQELLDRPLGGAGGSGSQVSRRDRLVNEVVALEEQLAGLLRLEQPDEAMSRRIRDIRGRLDGLDLQIRQAEAELLRENPAALTLGAALTHSPEEVAAALPHGAVLLEYALLEDELGCWVVDRNGMRDVVRVPVDATRLRGGIVRYAESCRDPAQVGPEEHERLGSALAEVLLGPVADHVAAARRLVIIPFGPAHGLPFATLPHRGGLLVDRCSVIQAPSSSLLPRLVRRRSPAPRALVVGDPAGPVARRPLLVDADEPAAPLPFAQLEADAVAASYREATLPTPHECTAEEVAALLPTADVVHLATHVLLEEEVPMLSAVLLAHGTQLTLHELMGMRLEAELMVLSSCESGLGAAAGGDEVAGLTRAVLAAGVPTAVVALWPVVDLVALLLMSAFHAAYAGGATAADALRGAQRTVRDMDAGTARSRLRALGVSAVALADEDNAALLENLDLPVLWAPFVTVGAG